jgi:NADPH2:quinone reductase
MIDTRGFATLSVDKRRERGGFRMRAAWYERGGPAREVLTVGEMDAPRPAPGEVLVRVRASGVNPGEVKKRADWMGFGIGYPRVILHSDGAGTIEEVGEGLSPSRVGERVWVWGAQSGRPFGTAAQYAALPSEQAVPLLDGVGFEVGACLGIPARTAHRCVFADGSVSGETVLVSGGAGAVGSFAVSFAKWGGARVIATVGSEGQAEAAMGAGADHALNYRTEDVVARIREIVGGTGVGRVVEVAFGRNLALDAEVIALGGTIAAYASDAEPEPRLPFWPLLFKNVTIRLVGSDDLPEDAERQAVEDIAACLEAGALQPRIALRLPLECISEAHEAVEGGQSGGRVILDID